MSEHTKGPWIATTTAAGKGKITDSDGLSIATTTSGPYATQVANAGHIVRCVNAHDDMLEALEGIVADGSGGPKKCGHNFTCVCAWNAVTAAIKKARGEK